MRPGLGLAALELLEKAGCTVRVPAAQTCCGQPALNAGRRHDAKVLARKLAQVFADCDKVVAASGSCIGTLKTHMPALFAPGEPGEAEVRELAQKCAELSDFLVARGFSPPAADRPLRVAYHDSCAGLRELGIREQPRKLLRSAGHELVPLRDSEVCCGFGGSFAVKFGEISGQMAENKCVCATESDADVLAMGDLGCMLSLEGRMLRRGTGPRVAHFAELLVGSPAADAR